MLPFFLTFLKMDNKTYLDNANARDRAEWKSADAEPIKMLYVRHKLGNNYLSADGDMRRDILAGEIAKLIVHQPGVVVPLLHKYRIKVPSRSNSGLVSAVSDGLYNSQSFAKDIALAVARNRGTDGTYAADDKANPADTLGAAASLLKGIGDIFGGKKKAKAATAQAKAEAERDKAAAARALAEATKAHAAGKGMKDNMGLYIGLALVGAGLVSFGIWWFKFRKK